MVTMMGIYRVRVPPTMISRVGEADRHHACDVDWVDVRCCGKFTRGYGVHATQGE